MENDPLPNSDHIARYCPPGKCDESGNPSGTAFMLRPNERFLSVDWLEILHPTSRGTQIDRLRTALSRRLAVRKTAKIAVLWISSTCDYVLNNTGDRRQLEVRHHPYDDDPSHSGIHNIRDDDSLIADLIAQLIEEVHSS